MSIQPASAAAAPTPITPVAYDPNLESLTQAVTGYRGLWLRRTAVDRPRGATAQRAAALPAVSGAARRSYDLWEASAAATFASEADRLQVTDNRTSRQGRASDSAWVQSAGTLYYSPRGKTAQADVLATYVDLYV